MGYAWRRLVEQVSAPKRGVFPLTRLHTGCQAVRLSGCEAVRLTKPGRPFNGIYKRTCQRSFNVSLRVYKRQDRKKQRQLVVVQKPGSALVSEESESICPGAVMQRE